MKPGTRASLDKGNFYCSEPRYAELFSCLCLALRCLWESCQRYRVLKEPGLLTSVQVGDLLTHCVGTTIESDIKDPEGRRVVNNWFSLWRVCDILGDCSGALTRKPEADDP